MTRKSPTAALPVDLAGPFRAAFPGAGYFYLYDPARFGGKGYGARIAREPTLDDVKAHLGEGPGIVAVPLLTDNHVWWAALDLDERPTDWVALAKRAELAGLPVTVTRSKSGGAHVWLTFTQPLPAVEVRKALAAIAAKLSLPATIEMFPKQERLEPGEYANGINLPYAGGSGRVGITADGKELTLREFLSRLTEMSVGPEQLADLGAGGSRRRDGADPGSPRGNPGAGGRNNYLMKRAGFLYARAGLSREAVEAAIFEENAKADPSADPNFALGPLPESEVRALLDSAWKIHSRKDGPPSWVEELNADHAVVRLGGTVVVMREHKDPATREPLVSFSSAGALNTWLASRGTIRIGRQYKPLGAAWLESPHRREYADGVAFAPGSDLGPTTYNIWRGWAVEPGPIADGTGCARFLAHTRDVICDGNEDYARYVIGWLAHMVQFPAELPETAIVLQGENGVGKGAWVQYIADVLRPHFAHIQDSERLTARFNAHVLGKLLVFADEAYFAGDRRHAGQLKGLITERVQVLEKKFVEPITLRNYTRLILASNEDWVIPTDRDARRFLALEVNGDRAGDHAYFEDLIRERRAGGPAALLAFLRAYDLTGFNIRAVPTTDALAKQKMHSAGSEEGFVLSLLLSGRLPGKEERPGRVAFTLLVDEYIKTAQRRGVPRRSSENTLAHRLKGTAKRAGLLVPDKIDKMSTYVHPTGRFNENVEITEIKHGTVWQLPDLKTCRMRLEKVFRQKLDWESGPDEWVAKDADVPF